MTIPSPATVLILIQNEQHRLRHAARELLCTRHLVTSAQHQDLGLLGVAYLIVESPKLVMGDNRYKAIYGIFCPILEPE